MLGSVTLDLDPVDRGHSTVGGLSPRRVRILIGSLMILIFEVVGPHSPDHETETMLESSLHGQTNTTSHEIIGNFMTKMTESLEATLADRRGERAQSTSNDEALERFL
ncbi:hypothetical protein M9H77_23302 [Catharanthus roseus]|uniref:Uncharacterized protein n=1 Tax=Catharanthus roseus TaxID=4058 RepID=A0ACC0ATV2_CATRO|nr:hypothetical protein M9H77_23302 [Catharanthus roseus]